MPLVSGGSFNKFRISGVLHGRHFLCQVLLDDIRPHCIVVRSRSQHLVRSPRAKQAPVAC